jgi:hypothetical protein
VLPGEASPPKANPAVCVPADPGFILAVLKLFCSDQEVPLYSSVSSFKVFGASNLPPKAKPAV